MGHEFKTDLEDETPPIHRSLYKLSLLELIEAKKQIQDMVEHELVRCSNSLYGGPLLFAPKRDSSLWFYIDYRWLKSEMLGTCKMVPHHQGKVRRGDGVSPKLNYIIGTHTHTEDNEYPGCIAWCGTITCT